MRFYKKEQVYTENNVSLEKQICRQSGFGGGVSLKLTLKFWKNL
jgi:hypothetical protein